MADRTKLGRTSDGKGPQYVTTTGDEIRSAYNQNTEIPRGFGDPLLMTRGIQSVGNQQAGAPGAVDFLNYEPTGNESVKRPGLVGPAKLPTSKEYTK